jgi:hypothetical protein
VCLDDLVQFVEGQPKRPCNVAGSAGWRFHHASSHPRCGRTTQRRFSIVAIPCVPLSACHHRAFWCPRRRSKTGQKMQTAKRATLVTMRRHVVHSAARRETITRTTTAGQNIAAAPSVVSRPAQPRNDRMGYELFLSQIERTGADFALPCRSIRSITESSQPQRSLVAWRRRYHP